MNLALRKPMTLAEFLAWEERQELRHEFDGMAPVAMPGGTKNHSRIKVQLAISIGGRLRGKPCEFFYNHRFQVAAGQIRYPDGMVLRPPHEKTKTIVHNPTIVFEVLGQSTRDTDLGAKLGEYQDTPSVERYVLIEQDFVGATVHARSGDAWVEQTLSAGDDLSLPEIGVTLPLAELYERVEFEPEDHEREVP